MAKFTTYAEIVTADSLATGLYRAGIKKAPPGLLLRDVLRHSGGAYEKKLRLSLRFREQVRDVARLTNDADLLRIADMDEVTVSLEHLRNADPETTRVSIGYRLDYTREESDRLGLGHEGPHDPSNTVLVEGNKVQKLAPDE